MSARSEGPVAAARVGVPSGEIPLEDLARIAEDEASCEVYGLLKRPGEERVTARACENPRFAEDLVRDIALWVQGDPRIGRFSVASENFESIHNHSAYAEITGTGAAPGQLNVDADTQGDR